MKHWEIIADNLGKRMGFLMQHDREASFSGLIDWRRMAGEL
jgi:hypothetical protein